MHETVPKRRRKVSPGRMARIAIVTTIVVGGAAFLAIAAIVITLMTTLGGVR